MRQQMFRRPALADGLLDGRPRCTASTSRRCWGVARRGAPERRFVLGYRFALVSLAPVAAADLRRAESPASTSEASAATSRVDGVPFAGCASAGSTSPSVRPGPRGLLRRARITDLLPRARRPRAASGAPASAPAAEAPCARRGG